MAANTVLNYMPRKSVVHDLTGTTKLAFFLLFTFASMITYNTWVLLGLMAVSFAVFRLSHIKLREVRFMLVFMLVFLALNDLFIFLFDPNQGTALYGTRTVLCHLFWRYDLTAEQLFYMFNISLKYFVALPVAILFISATNPSEFAASLNSIGISYKVGYSVAIALRYIPDIQRDYHSISQAQQARGVEDLSGAGLRQVADGGDLAAAHAHVGRPPARVVDHLAAADDQVVCLGHGRSLNPRTRLI